MTESLTLAHISDVHLGPLPAFPARHWSLKRGLGYINWQRKRRHIHDRELADRLAADIVAMKPDHVAVTGDLVNIGLPEEYETATRWLATLGDPQHVTVVPGNHDIYVKLAEGAGVARWAAHMQSCGWAVEAGLAAAGFPFVRRIGPVALIGVNSAHPTPPAVASGRLGTAQRAALAHALEATRAAGLIRVVLIHHPPLTGQIHERSALADARDLEALISAHGADLVLHGHTHLDTLLRHPSRLGPVPVAGVASGSAVKTHGRAPLARYNIYRLWREAGCTRISVKARGLAAAGGPIVDLGDTVIA